MSLNIFILLLDISLAGQTFRGGTERLVTVVDFPCAIAECCDVQSDYSIRNNEVQSCDITSALCASSTCTRAIQRMQYTRVDLLRNTFVVTICVTSRLMKFLVHTKSRLQSPDVLSPPLNVWPARLIRYMVAAEAWIQWIAI